MKRKCDHCGETEGNGYAVAGHLKKRSNAMYFCKEKKCREVISTLCKCVNIMNRRLKEGAIYPAQKKTKNKPDIPSECQTMFIKYKETWSSTFDVEAFPHPNYFRDMGIEKI